MDIKLGRLRQWAGEVISSREKTSVNEEFAALEKDVELRKEGINMIIIASEAYHRTLTKKETSEALKEDEKLLSIDTLGIVMIQHGGQFGEDSTFGNALLKLGGAHCKIATLQEAYALTFKDTFLSSMERFRGEIKEYESLRKKLDSRKGAADAATAKFEKLQHGKKEKDTTEAQDEMERMKQRYEETVEDLRAYMHAIQENEFNQLQDLTALIDIELNYAQNYLNVLKEIKADFQDNVHPVRQTHSRSRSQILRAATNPENDSVESIKTSDDGHSPSNPKPGARHTRSNSNASNKSNKSNKSGTRLSRKRTNSATASIGGNSEQKERSRRMSMAEWASSAMGSVTGGSKSRKNKSDKDSFAALDDSPTESQAGEFGVTGKSSSFRSLSRLASKATGSSKEGSPRIGSTSSLASRTSGKILKPQSMQGRRKTVQALYDFNGSADELSFKAGTDIVVLNEVLDDWWMGEADGKMGLFPTSYTDIAGARADASLPPSLSRSTAESESRRASLSGRRSNNLTPKIRSISLPPQEDGDTAVDPGFITSDADEEDTMQPMVNIKTPVFYGGFGSDSESFTTDGSEVFEPVRETKEVFPSTEVAGRNGSGDSWVTFDGSQVGEREDTAHRAQQRDQKQRKTPPPQPKQRTISLLGSLGSSLKGPTLDPAQHPLLSRSKSDDPRVSLSMDTESVENGSQNQNSPMKKTPPPPPPRRQSQLPSAVPPIPVKKVHSLVAQSNSNASISSSTGSLPLKQSPYLLAGNENTSNEYTMEIVNDRSPFDSVNELGMSEGGEGGSCDRFRQNPFKPKGMCSNCLQFHVFT